MYTAFFKDKNRTLKPNNYNNNLPKGILLAVKTLNIGEHSWFKLSEKYQNNDFIQNYPVKKTPMFFQIKLIDVKLLKINSPNNIKDFLILIKSFKYDIDKYFKMELYESALTSLIKALRQFRALPKKLLR